MRRKLLNGASSGACKILALVSLCLWLYSCAGSPPASAVSNAPSRPPGQPESGPGGRDYKYKAVKATFYGTGETGSWVFTPDGEVSDPLPVIVFNHGWMGENPESYLAWIYHIVMRGQIVFYPVFQQGFTTAAEEITGNAIAGVKDALARLGEDPDIKVDLDRLAIVGHSIGGAVAVNMALASPDDFPEPDAIMFVEPGSWIATTRLGKIKPDILLLAVVGADDNIAGDFLAERIIDETRQVPDRNKDLVTVFSDDHGSPKLAADHFAPLAPAYLPDTTPRRREQAQRIYDWLGAGIDALDYYVFWKLLDGLTDAAFYSRNREYALGDTREQRFTGYWSDGQPVRELQVK